jgi:hypothetical protein
MGSNPLCPQPTSAYHSLPLTAMATNITFHQGMQQAAPSPFVLFPLPLIAYLGPLSTPQDPFHTKNDQSFLISKELQSG